MRKKTEFIVIRVEPHEKEMLKSASKFYGMSLSAFMLYASFNFANRLNEVNRFFIDFFEVKK